MREFTMLAPDFGGNDQVSSDLLKVIDEGYHVISAPAILSAHAIGQGDFDADDVWEKLAPEAKMLLLVLLRLGDSSPAEGIFPIDPRIYDGQTRLSQRTGRFDRFCNCMIPIVNLYIVKFGTV